MAVVVDTAFVVGDLAVVLHDEAGSGVEDLVDESVDDAASAVEDLAVGVFDEAGGGIEDLVVGDGKAESSGASGVSGPGAGPGGGTGSPSRSPTATGTI